MFQPSNLKIDANSAPLTMPSVVERIRVLNLAGTPFDIGLQHGAALGESIKETVQVYLELFRSVGGATPEAVRSMAMSYAHKIEQFDPRYMEEIRGIAEGAKMPISDILMLNARTEILTSLNAASHECTTFCFGREGILAQTWDWLQRLDGKPVLLNITHPDGHAVLTMTEPGIVGKIGLNSAGIGVGLNILTSSQRATGVPVHLLLRSALDSPTWQQAYDRLTTSEIGTNSAITLADDAGRYLTFEYKGGSLSIIRPVNGVLLHTNHYLDSPTECAFTDSVPRIVRADALIATLSERSVISAKRILNDREEGLSAISLPWRDEGAWGWMGTLCSIVMDLKNRTVHISRGHPAALEAPVPPSTVVDLTYDEYPLRGGTVLQ